MRREHFLGAALVRVLDDKTWVSVAEIYERLARELRLTPEEIDKTWKRNVRNALQRGKAKGELLWDRQGKYRLPEAG